MCQKVGCQENREKSVRCNDIYGTHILYILYEREEDAGPSHSISSPTSPLPRVTAALAALVPHHPPRPPISGQAGRHRFGFDGSHCNEPTDGMAVLGGGWCDPPGGGVDSALLVVAYTSSFNVTYLSFL